MQTYRIITWSVVKKFNVALELFHRQNKKKILNLIAFCVEVYF